MTAHPQAAYSKGAMKEDRHDHAAQQNIQGYEIRIQGALDPRWSDWFEGIEMEVEYASDESATTTIRCPSADQAQLRGMLNKVWDLNLWLISVKPIGPLVPIA